MTVINSIVWSSVILAVATRREKRGKRGNSTSDKIEYDFDAVEKNRD